MRILLVDDSPTSRNLMATVLEAAGYAVRMSASGEEALGSAAAQRPDLIITDIVMPAMDGFDFVSRLRADPTLADVPVIFYSGVKHERETRALARTFGVTHLIPKPGDPDTILEAVASALSLPAGSDGGQPRALDRDVLRLLGDELSDVMAERESTYLRLAGLIEIGRLLSAHRDPVQLLSAFCEMARDILGAQVAAVGIRARTIMAPVAGTGENSPQESWSVESGAALHAVGLDDDTLAALIVDPRHGVLHRLLRDDRTVRVHGAEADPAALGLPPTHAPLSAFLGVPVATREAIHGWFYVAHCRKSADPAHELTFSDDDERLAATLARQLAVAYENARLYDQLKQEYQRITVEVEERRRAERELTIRVRQLATLDKLSELALAGVEWWRLLNETTERVVDTMSCDYSNFAEVDLAGKKVNIVASCGPEGSFFKNGDESMSFDMGPIMAHMLKSNEPILVENWQTETRFQIPSHLQERGIESTVFAPVQTRPHPYGIITVHRKRSPAFTERDRHFVGSVAKLLATFFERRRAEDQLIASHGQLRELASRLQTIREDERTHIAREIHDELGQSLTALKMEVSFMGTRLAREGVDHVAPKIRSMSELIDATIAQVRKLSTELRPGVLDHLGLVAAVEWQAGEFENRTGITCEVTADVNDQGLSDERCTGLFRILQETLTNVARHAHATHVSVSLRQESGNLVLEVQDDGQGFDSEGGRFNSLGLLGMRERALLMGGQLHIGSVPGKGSKIAVRIPLAAGGAP